MITLSLCMIVKNEEAVLGRCLDCIKDIADEIIIVDTGSDDGTVAIAKSYTDKVYNFPWIDDFAAARNFSFSKATADYIIWLDADDIIDEANRQALLALKQQLDLSVDTVMMKYDIAFDENNLPTFSYYRERIFKRANNFYWIGEIHEVITPFGNILYQNIAVSHKKTVKSDLTRNLRIFEKMIASGKALDPRQQFYYARELYYNKKYKLAIATLNQFLTEGKGWVENNISACQDLYSCYRAVNENSNALFSLFKSFEYALPRAEVCCDIAQYFFDMANYPQSIFWYKLAATIQPSQASGAFCMPDCYGYLPYMQLCVCYDKLSDYKEAESYNEKAGRIKPNSSVYAFNKQYFEKIKSS